jgi:hypothetical protein
MTVVRGLEEKENLMGMQRKTVFIYYEPNVIYRYDLDCPCPLIRILQLVTEGAVSRTGGSAL